MSHKKQNIQSCFLFVILLLHVFHSSLYGHSKVPESLGFIRCKKHELEALQKFKQSFTNDPMNRLSSWVGQDCCQWDGITCDNVTNHVVKLNLRSEKSYYYPKDVMPDLLTCGWFDPRVSMVSSRVSSTLLELKLLTHLDLSGNDFYGSQIPEFIGSLRHLRYLNLSSANFYGPIPPQLGNLTNLVHLDLHDQICRESRYAKGLEWASSLLKLQSLDLSNYNLSRAHDTFKVLNTLPSLSTLSLSDCELHNSHLSEALIGNNTNSFFPTLRHLDLGWNAFEGPLPSVFKNMVSLRSLSLTFNNFSGSIPLWFRAMKQLEVLVLSDNGFNYVEGGITGIMGNPCNFKHLDLSGNRISQGDIIESLVTTWCGAFKLKYLDLSNNKMNGSLPFLLGQFTNLSNLDLSNNEFKGQIPASFVKLSAFKYLDLSHNQLSGLIPDFIRHSTQIEHLDISSNSLQGTVFGIGNLSKVSYLDMNYNNLNLNLDSSLRPPFQLRVFNVHSCVINTVVFPQWLRNQTRLEYLDLSYTGISGELPRWLWNSSSLRYLYLSGNGLTGSLPQHKACDGPFSSCYLESLNLHGNLLTGTIPKWLGHIQSVVDLSSNQLTGAFFDGNNASSLFKAGVLDLSENMLSGEIQFVNVNQAPFLEILSLRGNHFNGPIPSQLCNIRSLTILILADNRLTGHIPRCLGSMPFYNTVGYMAGSLEIEEIVKGKVELFTGITPGGQSQSILDLSSNYLVGTIPEELTNISALFALNLSYNHLTGHIPENIGNLKTVESLDLSNNHLSGTIPQSLSSISWISKLNLSNNNLHGPIPTGNQLQTLDDPSIYANNSGLCGFPLPINCTKPDPPPSLTNVNPTTGKDDVEKKDKYEKLWFILAIMSGVATGFWGVVGTLVIKRSWRQAYFRYVEDLADRLYVPVKVWVNKLKRSFNENS